MRLKNVMKDKNACRNMTSKTDKEISEKKPAEDKNSQEYKKQTRKEDIRFIVVFVFFFSLFRFFAYDWYIVPSCSMVPTLLIGDMPFVEKWRYGYSKHSIWFSPNLFSGRLFFKNNVKRGA